MFEIREIKRATFVDNLGNVILCIPITKNEKGETIMRNKKLELECRIAALRGRTGRENSNIVNKLERRLRAMNKPD